MDYDAVARKCREDFEMGRLGGPMFAARDDEQLERIAGMWDEYLAALLRRVAEQERERCAKLADEHIGWVVRASHGSLESAGTWASAANDGAARRIATAIRRGADKTK